MSFAIPAPPVFLPPTPELMPENETGMDYLPIKNKVTLEEKTEGIFCQIRWSCTETCLKFCSFLICGVEF